MRAFISSPGWPPPRFLLIFAGVIIALVIGSIPAFKAFGFSFLWTSKSGTPTPIKFGALPSIYGTLVTSVLAMLVAVPVGIGIAIFLTELCPRPLRRPIGIAIELLAGIPSIIYGIWGLFVFAPWFQAHVQQPIIDATAGHSRDRHSVRRRALRHRHLHRRPDPFHHDPAFHLGGDARCVRDRAHHAEGSDLWPGLHHLGSDVAGGAAFRPLRRGGRRHAGAGPGAGRNHGGHLRDRQRPHHRSVAVRAGHHHLGHHRQ